MARESATFLLASEALERFSPLTSLEARGTVRLALRRGGFEPQSVGPEEMRLVLDQILPAMLETRGIVDGRRLCRDVERKLRSGALGEDPRERPRPDVVFQRLFSY